MTPEVVARLRRFL